MWYLYLLKKESYEEWRSLLKNLSFFISLILLIWFHHVLISSRLGRDTWEKNNHIIESNRPFLECGKYFVAKM